MHVCTDVLLSDGAILAARPGADRDRDQEELKTVFGTYGEAPLQLRA